MPGKNLKIAIIGSRSFNDYELVKSTLDPVKDRIEFIVSGGARGADKLGEVYAEENNIKTKIYLPNWDEHGKAAGFIRNKQIVENADIIIIYWDGESKGSKSSINIAKKLNFSSQQQRACSRRHWKTLWQRKKLLL